MRRVPSASSSSADSNPWSSFNQQIMRTSASASQVPKVIYTPLVLKEAIDHVVKPDYYNFDNDRTEASFRENQVWAAYDPDEMPRFYVLVHRVISQEPLTMCFSWLNCENNEELGPMEWVESGYFKTSGRFTIGKRHYQSINPFSHKVKGTIRANGCVDIYPKRGDVWALYSNWSPSWGFWTPSKVVNEFEMVEVVQDFDEARGVTVVPLVKVVGFQHVFRRKPSRRTFPKEELFRFSHSVASHLITDREGEENDPQGYMELDPAALPPELLMFLSEEEIRMLETKGKKPKQEVVENEKEEDNNGK